MKNIHSTPMGGRESLFEKPGLESATLPKRPCPGLSMYLSERKFELVQVSLSGFQKSFLFWVAGMILCKSSSES